MNLRTLFLAIGIGTAVGACASDDSTAQKPGTAGGSDVVNVPNVGMIQGSTTAGMRSFKGIPYAAPPVGALRWKPPQKAAPLSGVFEATKFGSGCVQASNGSFGSGSTDEDCLFLNVYTPTGPGPYPVMFWIHGGAFLSGDATPYDASQLVAQGVVVVTINYRLGLMGFLAHPAIDNGAGVASTNFGLLDQQFALQWVHDNIASFGGDETNVTIFGESAGGFSVESQWVMPGAHGLFHKAIVESGAYGNANQPSLDDATKQGAMFATGVHCPDPCTADFLRGVGAADVLAAQQALNLQTLIPSIDGTVIPTGVGAALASGAYEKVPVIEGSNHDEWALFVAIYLDQANIKLTTEMDYETAAAATLGVSPQVAAGLAAQYPLADYMMDPAVALTTAGTDVVFACPARAASIQLSANAATYEYEFSDENTPEGLLAAPASDPGFKFGAAHGSELQFLWSLPTSPGQTLSADEQALSATMVKYWTQFAKTGDPNVSGSPTWPKYTAANDSVLTLNTPASAVAVTTGFKSEHKCQ